LPLWDTEHCPHVLRLLVVGSLSPRELARAPAIGFRPSREVLLSDGTAHLAFGRADRSLQIRLGPLHTDGPPRLVVELPTKSGDTSAWLNALARYSRLRATGQIDEQVPIDPRGSRLFMIMRALDGSLAGRSQREVAAMLFGPQRVEADWRDPGQHIRDRVRRAIRRGYTLMKGGYLELLR